jgi:hypothetical protein
MRWHEAVNAWTEPGWRPAAVLVDRADRTQRASDGEPPGPAPADRLVTGTSLQIYPDENDGYFENWAAPEPKVFLLWRMEEAGPCLVSASVSYGEGTRMLDSGDRADGLPMPPDIHAWLGAYLVRHYQPPAGGRRAHG